MPLGPFHVRRSVLSLPADEDQAMIEPQGATAGVLPDAELDKLIACGAVSAESDFADGQVQPASLDLRLSDDVYRIRASFLPGAGGSVGKLLHDGDLQMHRMNISDG
ncbi:MAG: 2'-deoxycytidine 5'-triphosphate deaminase, partial [Pseudomonadota bacterium]